MSSLNLKINHLRSIKSLNINLPLTPGLYAITGKNGSGKSSTIAAIASLFFSEILKNYFSNCIEDNSEIKYEYKNMAFSYILTGKKWESVGKSIYLHGFYEGSLIHGNRFRDSHYRALKNASTVKIDELIVARSSIKKQLGFILHDDETRYENLYKLKSDRAKEVFSFRGSPYFIVTDDKKLISQLSLSTGENLLLSLLHSIDTHIHKRQRGEGEYLILLDEVELALHPSALNRLLDFLEKTSKTYKLAIYFSTHSTDLVRRVNPKNIFFLNKHFDNTVEVINPCYPAYATRNIFMHDGYDYLFLVEDDLTKKIINWLLKKEKLLSAKLIHILPCGGWENVLSLHNEIMNSNFLGAGKKALTILDGDIEHLAKKQYFDKGLCKNLNIAFLPIYSIEKFLRNKLVDNLDHGFFRDFNDSFFHKKSLEQVMSEYNKNPIDQDKRGKHLLKLIDKELNYNNTSIEQVDDHIVEYIVSNENMDILAEKLKKTLQP